MHHTPHSWLKIGDKAYCEGLRAALCTLAFQQQDQYSLINLLRFLLDHRQLQRMKQVLAFPSATSILASFGIHRCTGCGGDYMLHQEKYGKKCNGCDGSGWMHEVDNAVVYFAPGMFEVSEPHHRMPGIPKWRIIWNS